MCATLRSCKSFLRRIEQYLEFFMGEIGGYAATPLEIKERALRLAAEANPLRAA